MCIALPEMCFAGLADNNLNEAGTMLTRQAIKSGAYLENFESLSSLWPLERIEASLSETMQARPADTEGVWIFAYGSLMWNPMVEVERRSVATLHEWHRSFCLRMLVGRGAPDMPGRMLALEPGGHTQGVALKLPQSAVDEELRVVWIREMVLGSYKPTWAPLTLADGTETHAIAFVADNEHEQFEADSSVATVAPLIGSASGKFGTNAEYLFRLRDSLSECGLQDAYVAALVDAILLASTRAEGGPSGNND